MLADKTWDNTGLLLEAPHRADLAAARPTKNVVLLTIDLTSAVADEAIDLQSSMIVSYHPVIFRPLKALTSASTQQDSLLRLAQMGISVYSPHTAVDATVGGVNDWLADVISGGPQHELSRTVIEKAAPGPGGLPQGFESSGFGRIVVLCEPSPLAELVARVKVRLDLRHLMVANADRPVRKIALCAGSGASLFRRLANSDVDLFVTGELAHHEALAAKENGISVICCVFFFPLYPASELTGTPRLPYQH